MTTSETRRAEAASDAVVVIRLLTQGRLDDCTAYLSTIDLDELADLLLGLAGLSAALLQELDATYLRHGEPACAASMLAGLAQWDGQIHD